MPDDTSAVRLRDPSRPPAGTVERDDDRGVSPAVGVALGVVLVAGLAATVAVVVTAVDPEPSPPRATFAVEASADGWIRLTHRGGDAVDVRRVELVVRVDGRRLDRPPPVPFFSAEGFVSGPTGPFNSRADPRWTAGERAGLRVASTNHPRIAEGSRVTVTVLVDDRRVWSGTTVAGRGVGSRLTGPPGSE